MTLYLSGVGERVFLNLDYLPVFDEGGRPAGVLAVVVETTAQVLAERRRELLVRLDQRLCALNADPEARVAERTAERDRVCG